MKVKQNPLKLIKPYMDGYEKTIFLGRFLAAVSALLAMVPYYEIWKLLKIAISGKHLDEIPALGWKAVGVVLISMLLYVLALLCTHLAAFHIQAVMRKSLMKHIMTLPLGVFDEEGTGKIRRTVNDSTAATETYIAHNLPDKAVAAATPVGIAVLMIGFDWKIGVLCLIPVLIGFCFIAGMMGPKMQESMKYYQNAMEVISNEGVEYVRGIPVVKTFGQTVFSFKRFSNAIDDFTSWATDYTKKMSGPMVRYITAINAVFVALIAGAYFFGRNGVSGELLLNTMYYIMVTPLLTVAMTKLAYSGEQEMTVVDAITRVNHIFEIDSLQRGGKKPMPTNTEITLENVSYCYPNATKNAISNMNITIREGSHVAFVGPSGGGKTTTAQLIARFFDVKEGSIKIGGVDVKDIDEQELMKNISFVFQDSHLLKESILDNVRMANPKASEEQVLQALKKAQCQDIIEKLPDGIHTVIGAKGTYLSGGEQQRIAIARAFLKNAPIVILDEATAFADPDNESSVQKAFEELAKDKTVIMIAHRLTTVVDADCIYVLQEGSCIEKGTHQELINQQGRYESMFGEYMKSVQWKVGA
ncbi:MAG: ABC transporter ATP-binding protein/permease [Lachnospiraceae bacterium]|nr:ABC transporter ATP-binding protein/permease [Lachnospiraceae bacterium]